MNVDTGQFEAIASQVDNLEQRLDALSEGILRSLEAGGLIPPESMTREAYRLGWDAGLRRGRTPDPQPRHGRPRHLWRIK